MFNSFKNDRDRGFTLVELMVVLVIIGIVAAIASPSFVGLISRNRLNGSLQQLLGAIKETQRQAKLCFKESYVKSTFIQMPIILLLIP